MVCSRKKILFLFVFIVLLFNLLTLFSYASTEIFSTSTIDSAGIDSSGLIYSRSNYYVYSYDLIDGHSYTFVNGGGGDRRIGFSSASTVSIGDTVDNSQVVYKGSDYNFVANANTRLFVVTANTNTLNLHLYDNGMYSYDMNTSLIKLIEDTDFFSPLHNLVPYIGVVVVSCFGFFVISRLVNKSFN